MIIEDAEDTAELLSMLLEMKGVQARIVLERNEGLSAMIANPVGLIIPDLHMPGYADGRVYDLRIRAEELDADGNISEPFSPDQFFAAVKPFISFAAD